MPARRLEITVPEALFDRIESARGDVPRATFVKRAVEKALGGQGSGDTRSVASPRESGFVKEMVPTESPAPPRPSVKPSLADTWRR